MKWTGSKWFQLAIDSTRVHLYTKIIIDYLLEFRFVGDEMNKLEVVPHACAPTYLYQGQID